MPPESRKLLVDIQEAVRAIQRHASNITVQDYENDVLIRSLVERQCEIVGEALRRLERLDPGCFSRIANARRIIDFRNVISHGYDRLDSVIVTQVIRDHLPRLVADVDRMLLDDGC